MNNAAPLRESAHYLVRALLLAGFAMFIVHLVRSGDLNLYIAPRMQFVVKLSALGLYAVAAQQLYSAIRTWFDREHDHLACECNHELPATWGKSLLLYGWFAFPLLIGFVVPDGMLGSSIASAKGVQFSPQLIVKPASGLPTASPGSPSVELPSDSPLFATTDEFTDSYAKFGRKLASRNIIRVTDKQFIETLTTIDLYRSAFIGKTIELNGFVYRENAMGTTQFGVSRFSVNCCSADASPYGIMAIYDKANTLATDEWVTVTGKLGTTVYNNIEIIQILVDKVVSITPPDDPYVSSDLDFGLE
ncbi:TIGR03943 family putative permease subunit [Cohnella mopanensis]|uniref:TIGR03943 family putative permease subunit n=1 Tax=Cohnella mopanensis TaxID=2911966 RepID=UPI001EF8DA13|nr:TIGR03943 family protein [Cohnella mopanensis]